jgi:hypothetical protein
MSALILDAAQKLSAFAAIQFPTKDGVTGARTCLDAGVLPALITCYEVSIPLLALELGVSVGKPPSAKPAPARRADAPMRGVGEVDEEEEDEAGGGWDRRERDAVLVTARRRILDVVHALVTTAYVRPLSVPESKGRLSQPLSSARRRRIKCAVVMCLVAAKETADLTAAFSKIFTDIEGLGNTPPLSLRLTDFFVCAVQPVL